MPAHQEKFSLRKAATHGAMIGGVIGGAWNTIDFVRTQPHELFAQRGAITQEYSGDMSFSSRRDRRAPTVQVNFGGEHFTSIPSSSFGHPFERSERVYTAQANFGKRDRQVQKSEHKARQSETWVAKGGSHAKETRAANLSDDETHTSGLKVLARNTQPEPLYDTPPAEPVQIPGWVYGVGITAGLGYEAVALTIAAKRRGIFNKVMTFAGMNVLPIAGLACAPSAEFTPAPPITQTTEVMQIDPGVLYFQEGSGTLPETAHIFDVPFSSLEPTMTGLDLTKVPEAHMLLGSLRDVAAYSGGTPLALVVNGEVISYVVPNSGNDLKGTYEHISDGKDFSLDIGLVQIPVNDPSGKEHYLLSYNDASGNTIVRQAVYDEHEQASKPGQTVLGTLRTYELVPGTQEATATLIWGTFTKAENPGFVFWELNDPQDGSSLALEKQIEGVTSIPTAADTLIKLNTQSQLAGSTQSAPTESVPSTIQVTATSAAPTETVPQPTPTEAGPSNGDRRTVTENGHDYRYVYDAESGNWLREVANFHLMDYPYENFMPYVIRFAEGVPGERDVITMTHHDDTPGYGKNASGSYDPMPIKAALAVKIRERYFAEDTRSLSNNEQQDALRNEMGGNGTGDHRQAYLPIITSDGTEASVKLSPDSGIILTVLDKDTMFKLGLDGQRVATWHVEGITFYSEVYGVDARGNMLARLATDGSFADLTDNGLRQVFMTFVANLAEHKDQREQGLTVWTDALVFQSKKEQPNGTEDLVIERVP